MIGIYSIIIHPLAKSKKTYKNMPKKHVTRYSQGKSFYVAKNYLNEYFRELYFSKAVSINFRSSWPTFF